MELLVGRVKKSIYVQERRARDGEEHAGEQKLVGERECPNAHAFFSLHRSSPETNGEDSTRGKRQRKRR